MSDHLFTTAAISRALGCSKQNVHQRLAIVPADGEQLHSGNLAKAWKISSLPPALVRQLSAKAESKRYRTVDELLFDPSARYEPAIPMAEIAPGAIERARKLRAALRPILPLRNDLSIAAEQLSQRGIEAYRHEVGHTVTPRHWRALFDRAIERDNGAEGWERLEIYLEENPPQISARKPISVARERGLEVLESALTTVAGISVLNVEQKVYLWTKACDELQSQIENGAHQKKTKRAIVKTLIASGWFGTDKETIRRNLNRKWVAYCTGEGKLTDGRSTRDQRLKLPASDRNKVIA